MSIIIVHVYCVEDFVHRLLGLAQGNDSNETTTTEPENNSTTTTEVPLTTTQAPPKPSAPVYQVNDSNGVCLQLKANMTMTIAYMFENGTKVRERECVYVWGGGGGGGGVQYYTMTLVDSDNSFVCRKVMCLI